MQRLLNAVFYFLSGFVPKNRRKVLFGAWMGRKFADNPKYLLLHLAEHGTGLDLVWIGEESVCSMIPANLPVRFVRRGSLKALWERLTAGTCFVTHGFSDLGTFNLMRGACRVYLGHGLAIKHMGAKDRVLRSSVLRALLRFFRRAHEFRYYVASSQAHRTKLLAENVTWNIVPEQVLDTGQPRIDFLLKNRNSNLVGEFRARFLAHHGVSSARRIITYMPTFRDRQTNAFSFTQLKPGHRERIESLLADWNAAIFEKNHLADVLRGSAADGIASSRVFSVSGDFNVDTQELLSITDLLITDYSGCYVDFLVLDRPVIHFAYDRKYYEGADRGLYFDLNEVAGGPVVESFDELCATMDSCLRDCGHGDSERERAKRKLVEFERGTACERIVDVVFGKVQGK